MSCHFHTQAESSTSLEISCETPSTSSSTQTCASTTEALKISEKGQEKVKQNFQGRSFPKKDGRSFKSSWVENYEWIEYSSAQDKVFCYACRQFGTSRSNDVFSTSGFNSWQAALSAGKGLKKHEASELHIKSMFSWREKQSREGSNTQISTLLNETVLAKRRFYFTAIVETVLFLVKNELPLRGDWDQGEHEELGLFRSLFQFILQKDDHLRECQETMPLNALYTSAQIQNEIIHTIAEVLRTKIVSEINESSFMTLMADGTTDKNGIEVYSIAFRYIKNSVPKETLLAIEKADDISASGIKTLITNRIESYGIDQRKIISQCYDGAAVMSGHRGGVQKLLQQHYNRVIPYVHCFNHRLHLVVVAVISENNACRLFIGQVRLFHNFFRRFKVRKEYGGTNIPQLIEQRWSGHLKAIQSIHKNYDELIKTLLQIKEGNSRCFDSEDLALASGLIGSLTDMKFIFLLHFLHELLNILEPANKILQRRDIGFRLAMPVIEAVLNSVQSLRTDESFDRFLKSTQDVMDQFEHLRRPQRIRERSSRLSHSIVMETLGEDIGDNGLKPIYFEVIDNIVTEINRRFHENNDILSALSKLNDDSLGNLDLNALKPLETLGLKLPSESEFNVVRKYLEKERENQDNSDKSYMNILYAVRSAFPVSFSLFEACETFGSSTSFNECAFSALARIDTVRRMSMLNTRLCDLTFLAFEKKLLGSVKVEDIIRKFSARNRKIQLF